MSQFSTAFLASRFSSALYTNAGKLPFFVSMSCLTGYFVNTAAWDATPLVELLMSLDNKGSVAALMPTGMTTTEGQHILNTALFEEIFTKDRRQLGEAIARAKMTLLANGDAYYEEISRTFLLFGDPAMQLKVPIPRRPTGLVVEQQGLASVVFSWQSANDADGNPAAGYNIYRKTAADLGYTLINSQPITSAGYSDNNLTIGTRYYYVVRSVDADGTESVDSESVSIVPTAPATSLTGTASKGGGGGGGCFISTSQEAFNQDIMNGLAFLGVVVILWRLIMRIKAMGRGAGRRSSAHRGANSVFDETTDLGFQVMTEQGNLVVTGTDDRAGKEKQAPNLTGEPPAVVDNSPY